MLTRLSLAAALLTGIAASACAASRAAVTIYSRDLAFVREARTLTLRGARDTVRLDEIPERMDVSSARLALAGRARATRLASRFDVASGDRLLEVGRGRRVQVVLRENRVVEGALLSADGGWLTVRGDDGALETVARGGIQELRLAQPPPGLAFEPTLEAVVEGAAPGRVEAELSYLTGGLSWSAEHTLVRTGETTALWTSSISVENASGRSFDVPRLALVAGDPRLGSPAPPRMVMARGMEMSMAAEKADVTEQSFAEYHLYTLDHPALLRDRETQILTMLETRPVKVTPRYLYRYGTGGVTSQIEVMNSAAAGLGVPLPEGRVRFYEKDAQGELHFTGETRIRHTPRDEKLTLDVGTAFDLVAERREVYNRRISDREREYGVEIKLRNRKPTEVRIVVEEGVASDFEVLRKSHEFTRKDAGTIQFVVPVAANQETVLSYAVRTRY
jgi:hypothetical protein